MSVESNQQDLLLETLGNVALTPLSARGIFLLLTRIHYSDPNHFGVMKEKMGNFLWHSDPKIRKLHVDYDYNYDPKNQNLRPAIFVGTGDISFLKPSVDSQKSQTDDLSGEEYAQVSVTPIILRHIGKSPDESLQLGDLSFQFFNGMRKLLQERLHVYAFEVQRLISSRPFEARAEQANQPFITDLIMQLQYNSIWLTVREGHRIKTITYKNSLALFALDS